MRIPPDMSSNRCYGDRANQDVGCHCSWECAFSRKKVADCPRADFAQDTCVSGLLSVALWSDLPEPCWWGGKCEPGLGSWACSED